MNLTIDQSGWAAKAYRAVQQIGWKYVDEKDAIFVEKGSVRLREFSEFAKLESDRADPFDSAVVLTTGVLDLSNPAHRETMKRHSALARFDVPEGRGGIFANNTIVTQLTGYAYCASLPGTKYEPKNGGKQALFEVDLGKLLPTLRAENPTLLGPGGSGVVKYTSVNYSEKDADRQPSPFVKDLRFEHEREVRLAFSPAAGFAVRDIIDTQASEAVAACFKRIG